MQNAIQGLKRSVSIKAAVIGGLVLVLLIPVSMINGIVHDREAVHQQARWDIMRAWGQPQLVAGPVLIVPYTLRHIDSKGNEYIEERRLYVLPETLSIETDVRPEVRYRGLHKVPIYSTLVSMRGRFAAPDTDFLGIGTATLSWDKASVALTVTDARAISEAPSISINGGAARFESGGPALFQDTVPSIVAPAGEMLATSNSGDALDFETTLSLNGSDSLQFVPLGDTTDVRMTSDWPSPSFVGSYLPRTREISDDGFTAAWQIASLGRELPSQWTDRNPQAASAHSTAFGVSFYMPVSLYQSTLRATKYAVLFIGLSFVAYFLFEILAGLRLHPLQYLLVGFANAMFYLLLLSLAEHVGFGWAYLASALASAGLIGGYSATILGSRRRASVILAVLALLYAFLYMALKAESYALLAGAAGLWVALAAVMYMTRRIDWYAQSGASANE